MASHLASAICPWQPYTVRGISPLAVETDIARFPSEKSKAQKNPASKQ